MIRSVIFLLAAPLVCCAAESCPWINAGTVAGILGGAADIKVTQTSCEFTHRAGKALDTIEIEVETMTDPQNQFMTYLARCKSKPVMLRAIGNETMACSAEKDGLAIGRVRDRVFTIRVKTNDHGTATEALESKAEAAARHVAGNLF